MNGLRRGAIFLPRRTRRTIFILSLSRRLLIFSRLFGIGGLAVAIALAIISCAVFALPLIAIFGLTVAALAASVLFFLRTTFRFILSASFLLAAIIARFILRTKILFILTFGTSFLPAIIFAPLLLLLKLRLGFGIVLALDFRLSLLDGLLLNFRRGLRLSFLLRLRLLLGLLRGLRLSFLLRLRFLLGLLRGFRLSFLLRLRFLLGLLRGLGLSLLLRLRRLLDFSGFDGLATRELRLDQFISRLVDARELILRLDFAFVEEVDNNSHVLIEFVRHVIDSVFNRF